MVNGDGKWWMMEGDTNTCWLVTRMMVKNDGHLKVDGGGKWWMILPNDIK